ANGSLYQQNHCGVYKSSDGAHSWTDIKGNLPSDFGFPIAVDPHNPDTLFVIPEGAAGGIARHNIGDQFTVYRSDVGGDTWRSLTTGLPAGPSVRLNVLRHGMCT